MLAPVLVDRASIRRNDWAVMHYLSLSEVAALQGQTFSVLDRNRGIDPHLLSSGASDTDGKLACDRSVGSRRRGENLHVLRQHDRHHLR